MTRHEALGQAPMCHTTSSSVSWCSPLLHHPRITASVRTLCGLLAHTGCRLSEALWLTADRVDLRADLVVFETLKKRRSGVYRAVPVPHTLLDMLDLVHGLRPLQGVAIAAVTTGCGPGAG
jgi:integrase